VLLIFFVGSVRQFTESGFARVFRKAGKTVFKIGQPVSDLYIVVGGRLRLLVKRGNQPQIRYEIGRGETANESEILTKVCCFAFYLYFPSDRFCFSFFSSFFIPLLS
jgi:hypothetical protein